MAVKLTKQQIVERLRLLLDQGIALAVTLTGPDENGEEIVRPAESYHFFRWHKDTLAAMRHIFGPSARFVQEFEAIRFVHDKGTRSYRSYADQFWVGYAEARALLESIIREVEEFWDENMVSTPSAVAEQNESGQVKPATRDVFIVHGHDDGFRQTVARVLHQLELNPIILHEKANEGKAIMEKFDVYGNVSYAVALFTPDDLGAAKGKVNSLDDLRPRARQNVVFELGYFIGRRGRSNACALVKGQLELPSDYSGVIYIQVDDAGAWRYTLVRELRAAGFEVDANRLL